MKNFKRSLNVIGLMSGTSMDGIDCTLVKTNGINLHTTDFNILHEYGKVTNNLLRHALNDKDAILRNKSQFDKLNKLITYDHFHAVKKLMKISNITPDIIGFHGQTLFHDPSNALTIQLGDSQLLKKLLSIPIVSHFRQKDIKNGGQGAPLAPVYHKLIMKKLKLLLPCCFINIGGITNLTFWDGKKLVSFDTGPGNVLLDIYTQAYLNKKYDEDGYIASKGSAISKFNKDFLKDNYLNKPYPKSLDRNQFNYLLEMVMSHSLNNSDILATLTNFTVIGIKKALKDIKAKPKEIIIMGGGANNKNLINKIAKEIKVPLKTAKEIGLNGDMIEAELIGFLAARRLYKLPITFPSTTGVKIPTSGGIIF